MEGAFFAVIFMFLLFFLVMVAISRWIFRVNDIVNRLDDILAQVKALAATQQPRQ
jgi:hypothetical protein